jgi:hypothetical protein
VQEEILLLIAKQTEEMVKLLEKRQRKNVGKPGRPSKEYLVIQYRKKYPDAKKMDCVRATKLSIKTVSKYWNLCDGQKEQQG